jgi:hypothetical protein
MLHTVAEGALVGPGPWRECTQHRVYLADDAMLLEDTARPAPRTGLSPRGSLILPTRRSGADIRSVLEHVVP